MKGDFERYLTAKETVDDRALDRRVLDRAHEDLRGRTAPRILEAGTGTGAFCRRFLGWDDVPDCTYVAVDTDPALLATARDRVLDHARDVGFEASAVDPAATDLGPPVVEGVGDGHDPDGGDGDGIDSNGDGNDHDGDPGETSADESATTATTVAALRLRGPAHVDVRLVAGDAVDVAARGSWEFLVAQAFVDLLSPSAVERLVSGVVDGGGVYLPITFDGGTAFSPSHPADEVVVDAYHATMNGGQLGATAGRRLLTALPDFGVELDAVGGSDWVVSPLRGSYPADESYFLGVVLDTIAEAVDGRVSSDVLDEWYETRRREREAARLHFLARNLDLYGRRA